MVQEQMKRLTSWRRAGQQQQGDLPMIQLDAIAFLTVDGSLQAAGTMTQVTGVAFVTVQNDYPQAVNIRQGFVAFQTLVDVVNPLPKPVGIEQGMDASQSVCAAGGLLQPTLPKAGPADLFPSVEAAHPGPEQHHRRFHHRRSGDAWLPSLVREVRDDVPREVEDLSRIGTHAARNVYRVLPCSRLHSISV